MDLSSGEAPAFRKSETPPMILVTGGGCRAPGIQVGAKYIADGETEQCTFGSVEEDGTHALRWRLPPAEPRRWGRLS
ncbi:hypothetical protein LMIY3S_03041 [Labrys miyagiensis]